MFKWKKRTWNLLTSWNSGCSLPKLVAASLTLTERALTACSASPRNGFKCSSREAAFARHCCAVDVNCVFKLSQSSASLLTPITFKTESWACATNVSMAVKPASNGLGVTADSRATRPNTAFGRKNKQQKQTIQWKSTQKPTTLNFFSSVSLNDTKYECHLLVPSRGRQLWTRFSTFFRLL